MKDDHQQDLVMKDRKASSEVLLFYLLNFIGQQILSLEAFTESPSQKQGKLLCLLSSLLSSQKSLALSIKTCPVRQENAQIVLTWLRRE